MALQSNIECFNFIEEVLQLCEENYSCADIYLQDEIFNRIRFILRQLEFIISTCASNGMENRFPREYGQLLQLNDVLLLISRVWGSHLLNLYTRRSTSNDANNTAPSILPVETLPKNGPGRPKLQLELKNIAFLVDVGFSISKISRMFGVHRNTIYAHMRRSEMELARFTDISRDELLQIVRNIYSHHPHCGVSMMQGHLKASLITVARDQVRSVLREIDPINSQRRWGLMIQRKKYSVPGPNCLWHIDGHHALIRWSIVTHGGVDGFSRLIVYLKSSANNKADTVLDLFVDAVNKYGLPSRVRADLGGENLGVQHFMEANRGTMRGSFIGGPSVHNTRIVRLWRDVFYAVIQTFYSLFYYLESTNCLDITKRLDMFCLHYVFIPRINKALEEFSAAYNHHPLRTEGHQSPKQVWVAGFLARNSHHHLTDRTPPMLDEDIVNEAEYGIDFEEMLNVTELDEAENNEFLLSEFTSPLSEASQQQLLTECDPSQISENYGIDVFLRAKDIVRTLVQ